MFKSGLKLGILCDTDFLIRLNQPQDELHGNARGYPVIADMPSSPNVQIYQFSGLFVGFALGGLVGGFRCIRLKPSSISEDSSYNEVPAYAKVDPPPIQRVKPCPEDEW